MKRVAILLTLSLMVALASAVSSFNYATCILQPVGNSGVSGNILIESRGGNIAFLTNLNGLTQTSHGMTIRTTGDIYGASTAGEVLGATAVPYDCSTVAGSIANVTNGVDGLYIKANLDISGANSIVGRVLAITDVAEGCNTTASATVLAQCVIGIGNKDFIPQGSGITPPASGIVNTIAYQAADASTPQSGICNLSPTTGNTVNGIVYFNLETNGSITVTAAINNLDTSSAHGIHIHGFGDLILANGSSVGGHWKTGSQVHNLPPNNTRELGDLGNVCVYESKIGYYKYNTDYFGNQNSVNNFIGRAVVIHAIRDAGFNATFGARIAQCVIGLGTATSHQTIPSTLSFASEPICTPDTTTTTGSTTTTTTTDATTTGTTTGSSSTIVPAFIMIISLISFLLL